MKSIWFVASFKLTRKDCGVVMVVKEMRGCVRGEISWNPEAMMTIDGERRRGFDDENGGCW